MADESTAAATTEPSPSSPRSTSIHRFTRQWLALRKPIPALQAALLGIASLIVCACCWWFVTRGPVEERLVSPFALPSPAETFASFPELLYDEWGQSKLWPNILTTLRRVALGFGLAVLVGVPLGVVAGCFTRIHAFLSPLIVFGRNIPLAALIPLTFFMFGIEEKQKVMFIFIACVAFIVADTAGAIRDVPGRYIDTAYTLGASTWQVIMKVLVPLGMPSVFNSIRLLFGLAFGYIMLAELVKFGDEIGGLGYLINISQRRGPRAHIYLIVLIIPAIALALDRLLFWTQRHLFPYRYGGIGLLHQLLRHLLHGWEAIKGLVWKTDLDEAFGHSAQQTTTEEAP